PSGLGEGSACGAACAVNAKQIRTSGMRRNPRPDGSERALSRPHETNVLNSIIEYMGSVLSLSRSCLFWFFGHWAPNRQRILPGKSSLSVFEPSAFILNCAVERQCFFRNFLKERLPSTMC